MIELYVRWMQETRRYAPATVARRLSTVCGFYRTLVIDGMLAASPAEYVRRPRRPTESPTLGLTHLQFEAMLVHSRRAGPTPHAVIVLLGLLGLRVSEACAVSLEDLGFEHGHRVVLVRGKGGTRTLMPLPPAVARALDAAIGDRVTGPILRTRTGARMDRHAAARVVRRTANSSRHRTARPSARPPPRLRHHPARRRRRATRRADRRPPCRPADHHPLRPGPPQPRPARRLHPRGLPRRRQLAHAQPPWTPRHRKMRPLSAPLRVKSTDRTVRRDPRMKPGQTVSEFDLPAELMCWQCQIISKWCRFQRVSEESYERSNYGHVSSLDMQ